MSVCLPLLLYRYESYLARYIHFIPGNNKPYCHLSPLTFSMYSMDHLDSVQRRKELGAYKPELSMISEVRHSMDNYGHFVSKALEKVSLRVMNVHMCVVRVCMPARDLYCILMWQYISTLIEVILCAMNIKVLKSMSYATFLCAQHEGINALHLLNDYNN